MFEAVSLEAELGGLTYMFDSKTLMVGVRYAIVSKRVGNTVGR